MSCSIESLTEAREAVLKDLVFNGLLAHLLELLPLNLLLLLLEVILYMRLL